MISLKDLDPLAVTNGYMAKMHGFWHNLVSMRQIAAMDTGELQARIFWMSPA